MAMIRLRHILILIGCLFSSLLLYAEDACDNYSRWIGFTSTKTILPDGTAHFDTTYYTPSEFFSLKDALPDYTDDGNDNGNTMGFIFRDTTCCSDYFELEAIMNTTTNRHIVMGLEPIFEPEIDWRSLRSSRVGSDSKKIEIHLSGDGRPKSPLRAGDITVMTWVYKDGVLTAYGDDISTWEFPLCGIYDITVSWKRGGGYIESLTYKDYTNNTSYTEDFSDCQNIQLFPECPPEPIVELKAWYDKPTCEDPTLRFHSESNLLEDFHWVDPFGREFSEEQNPVIGDGFSARSGTYWVWGKLTRCSEPVVARVDVMVPIPEPVSDTVQVVSCSNEDLVIGGKLVTEEGFYSDTVRTANGYCDSVTVYNVYLVRPKEEVVDLEICHGSTVSFKDIVYDKGGLYEYSEKSKISDCDSIHYVINVKENPTYFISRHAVICEGDTLEGHWKDGVYEDSLTSVSGCDSVVLLNLMVLPKPKSDTVKVISCEGDLLEIAGKRVTEDGFYSDTLLASNGLCDSVAVYDVHIVHTEKEEVELVICAGGSVEFNGKTYTSGGAYTDVLKSKISDCDSVYYDIHVEELPVYHTDIDTTICQGENFKNYTEPGVYTETFTAANGCDSVVVYTINLMQPEEVDVDFVICEGDSVLFNGKMYKQEGIYSDVLKRKFYDCDSVRYKINIRENPSYFVERQEVICFGESFEGHTETGIYTDSLTSLTGCDSIVQLSLEVLPKPESDTVKIVACEEDEVLVAGKVVTEDGYYEEKSFTVNGQCDSVAVYDVTILRPKVEVLDFEICEGDSVSFNGKTYKKGGSYADALPRVNYACDSVRYEINIKEHPTYFITRYDTICYGESLAGHSETGVYTDSLSTVSGCDSILQLNLEVLPKPASDTVEIIACEGDEVLVAGKLVTEDGYYEETLLAANGKCDSVAVYAVRILRPKREEVDLVICDGDSAFFNKKKYTLEGTYADTLKYADSVCDSILYEIHVKVNPTYFIARYDTICYGEALEGHTETGVYTDSLTTVNGCDSILQLNLEVLPEPKSDTVEVVACEGDDLLIAGQKVTEDGYYSENLFTVVGQCDSVAVYAVKILRPKREEVDLVICEGDSVLFNGKNYKRGGTYADTLKYADSVCDSVRYEILVKENPTYFIARYDTICYGETFEDHAETGVYTDSLVSVNGCDSVMQLNLEVLPKIVGYETVSICEGDVFSISDKEFTETGEYEVNMGSVGRCDSFVVVQLQVDPYFSLSKPEDVESCERVEAQLQVDSIPDAEYQWKPASFLSAANRFNPFVSTPMSLTYQILVRRGACADSTTLDVYVHPVPSIDRVELFPEKKEIVINAANDPDYTYSLDGEQWQTSPMFVEDVPVGVSFAYVRNVYGCQNSLPFYFLIPIYPEDHMSPNGDGIKDTWEVENLGYYKHYKVRIYDRYGKMLVEYQDEYPGWDGVYNGADMPSTDYWYVITVDELDYEVSGHFTLLRR